MKVCGSDLHSYFQVPSVGPTTTKPHYVTHETLPIVMGHEYVHARRVKFFSHVGIFRFSGTIVELGPGVDTSRFAIGQHAVAYVAMGSMIILTLLRHRIRPSREPVISCMEPTCGPCSEGNRNVCPHLTFIVEFSVYHNYGRTD